MTSEVQQYRLDKLEEDLKTATGDINNINKNLTSISFSIEKISNTLVKIEKVERDNGHLHSKVEAIENSISEIKQRQALFMGGVAVMSFVIGIVVKLFG